MTTPIYYLSISELNEKYRAGSLSPVEVTQLALDRIAEMDPKLNAFICVTAEAAKQAARLAEQEIKRIEREEKNLLKYKPLIKLYDQAEIINDLV